MDHFAQKILVFCLFYIGIRCDWIEITQRGENVVPKTSSVTKHFAFPRNEYVYTQPPNLNKNSNESPYLSTKTAATSKDKIIDEATENPFLIEKNSTSLPNSNDTPKTENRMDESNEMSAEKLVSATEEPKEETTDEIVKETDNFIPFLKKVQDEIIVKGHKNLKGKITMLKNLRDDLLLNIDERISHLWGGNTKGRSEAREHKEDDHDMHFPSNEGALMTIGFLTFAVFLIKLVLKLVQALKYKQSMVMVTPTMMTTNAALIGRRKRDANYEDQNRILQLINEYNFT